MLIFFSLYNGLAAEFNRWSWNWIWCIGNSLIFILKFEILVIFLIQDHYFLSLIL